MLAAFDTKKTHTLYNHKNFHSGTQKLNKINILLRIMVILEGKKTNRNYITPLSEEKPSREMGELKKNDETISISLR